MSGAAKEGRGLLLTQPFRDLVQNQAATVPAFSEALLHGSIETMLAGDVDSDDHNQSAPAGRFVCINLA